ncbi:TIGR01548 family HAD-type hydrolase [Oculatella sp. LEGE 06141]|nr:TIGR01548 family HAD-type hydrolase [Oculatella sp. LEGE 06141]
MSAIAVFDIDGVVRDVGGSYRRALADTVEQFTAGAYRPSQADIDILKAEGIWNNDWEASRELVYRYFETQGQGRSQLFLDYEAMVAFFQSRYRGPDPHHWTGYICEEPLLLTPAYLQQLTEANIAWGFFSGATRGSATYALEKRLGLSAPVLVAMEDAPGKPDPTGLFDVLSQLEASSTAAASPAPVLYVGDTVADMSTVEKARSHQPDRLWVGVGILPPHAQAPEDYRQAYSNTLIEAGAAIVLANVEQLTPTVILEIVQTASSAANAGG